MESKPVFELHKMPEGFIITSNEEIKEGDTIYDLDIKRIVVADKLKVLTAKHEACWYYKKIIAQQNQIDFSSLSEEEQKEIGLNQYDFAQMFYEILKKTYPYFDEWIEAKEYKKAQELLSDRRFTLEDVQLAFAKGAEYITKPYPQNVQFENEYKQSLSQKSWKVVGSWKNNKFKITQIIG